MEAPLLWPPDRNNWLMGKDPDAGKDWRQKETTKDEMVGWHHQLFGHEFEQALGVGDRQGSLGGSWGRKESDKTEQLKWTVLYLPVLLNIQTHIWLYFIELNTHTHTTTHKTEEIWTRLVDWIIVNILIAILYHSFARCYHWGKLGKMYKHLYYFLQLHVNF